MAVNKKLLTFLLFVCFSLSLKGQSAEKQIDFKDSLSVSDFIKSTTLCEKLKFIVFNRAYFCCDSCNLGFANLILADVTRTVKKEIFMPYSNGVIILSKGEKERLLQEQIRELAKDLNCQH